MKIVRGASKVTLMKKRLSLFTAILFGFVGLGLSPALAVDDEKPATDEASVAFVAFTL